MAAMVRERFGIDLFRYPEATIQLVLSLLPDGPCHLDPVDLGRVIAACSVGETMFLRHPEQFSALRHAVGSLPGIGHRPLSVWSAGCATGEEAYSLAAVLSRLSPVHVLGTDLNERSIERARLGAYRPWSMRGVDASEVEDWLEIDGLDVRVLPHLRVHAEFLVHNLVDGGFPTGLDVVFCRNVLLYFDPRFARVVLNAIHESLEPGGVLFLGYCDPAPEDDEAWQMEWVGNTRFFRKPSVAVPRDLRKTPRHPCGPARASSVPAPKPAGPGRRYEEQLSMARGLAAQRAFVQALRLLEALSGEFPLEVQPYALSSMIAEEAGLPDAALAAARRTLFLAPEEPVAHYLLGSCLHRVGELDRAKLHFRSGRGKLSGRTPQAPLPLGEGLTGSQLRRLIDARLFD